jgi:hypothetical protein
MADKRQSMSAKAQQATGSGAATAPSEETLSKAIGARYVLYLYDFVRFCELIFGAIAFALRQQLQTHPPSKALYLPPAQ